MTTTIRDLVQEALGNKIEGKFQITGTNLQMSRIKEDLRKEWLNNGLVIADNLPDQPFSTISFGGILIHFVEGEYFSIKEIEVDYTPKKDATVVYRPTASEDFKQAV